MTREYKKKEYIIRCGGAEAYLTDIQQKKKSEEPVYIYGTKDRKKAKRFTEEEARRIAGYCRAEMIKVNYKGGGENE